MDRHLLKSQEYLEEAQIKRVEHQAAAEHYGALTQLYAEQIVRIEAEIKLALQARTASSPPAVTDDIESLIPKSDSVLVYTPRSSHAGVLLPRRGDLVPEACLLILSPGMRFGCRSSMAWRSFGSCNGLIAGDGQTGGLSFAAAVSAKLAVAERLPLQSQK